MSYPQDQLEVEHGQEEGGSRKGQSFTLFGPRRDTDVLVRHTISHGGHDYVAQETHSLLTAVSGMVSHRILTGFVPMSMHVFPLPGSFTQRDLLGTDGGSIESHCTVTGLASQ